MGQDEGSGHSDRVVSAPGWRHPAKMREYIRSVAAFDRDLHKEVARQNAANKIEPESIVQQIIHDPLPVIETKSMDTNKTGFGGFKSIFGEGLGNLKKIASDLDEEMRSVVAEGQQVAEAGKQITDAARREIAEARAALAQFSNGAPE